MPDFLIRCWMDKYRDDRGRVDYLLKAVEQLAMAALTVAGNSEDASRMLEEEAVADGARGFAHRLASMVCDLDGHRWDYGPRDSVEWMHQHEPQEEES